ncbi:hypothetical protein [Paramagnetospirillum magneticum]|uniref:hypothetical protein n=1 Tax=Paramagnetospirillum magneticum TaxID=84159 RepID=UPI0005C19AFD|nr:hypothetical protein [Paramagnetospirillum magneticum]
MPYLDGLTPDNVGEGSSRLTVAYLEAVMLFPNDPERQARAMMAVDVSLEVDRHIQHLGPDELVPARDMAALVDSVRRAPRIEEFASVSKQAMNRGVFAGYVVLHVLARKQLSPKTATIGQAIKLAIEAGFGDSASNFNKSVRSQFMAVSHLWAAFVMLAQEREAEWAFPCRLDSIPYFLATAEVIRREGESFKPPQSNSTLLNPSISLKVPEGIALPQIQPLVFERL